MRLLLLSLILVSCGADESSPEPATATPQTQTITADDIDQHAMYIAPGAKLPTCSESDEGWLVYQEGFLTCSSGDWVAIDIKGKDGTNGIDGKDGAKGADGKDGQTAMAQVIEPNTYQDSYTGLTWRLFGINGNCGAGHRLPTFEEVRDAHSNGMFAHFTDTADIAAYQKAKTSSVGFGGGIVVWEFLTGDWASVQASDVVAASYCIEQEETAFNWLAPLDELCNGSLGFDTAQPNYGCFKIEHGIESYDVMAG